MNPNLEFRIQLRSGANVLRQAALLARARCARPLALLLAASAMAGCATAPLSPEQVVAQRAQERWAALIAGDVQKAYGYLSPASRALTPFEIWRATAVAKATVWKAAKAVKVECDSSERCKARVNIDHQPLVLAGRLGTITAAVDETWLLDNGEWWLLYTR